MNSEEKPNNRKHPSFLINLGKKIRAIRKQKGLTQEQLFLTTGIAADKICKIENGKINTRVGNIPFLAEALGKSVKEMMDFDYEKNSVPMNL